MTLQADDPSVERLNGRDSQSTICRLQRIEQIANETKQWPKPIARVERGDVRSLISGDGQENKTVRAHGFQSHCMSQTLPSDPQEHVIQVLGAAVGVARKLRTHSPQPASTE
jgi:hypothetical protein